MSAYWGARIDGEPYGRPNNDAPWDKTTWDTFERHAKKQVTVVELGQPFGSFDRPAMDACRSRGALPLLTMGLAPAGQPERTLAQVVNGSCDALIQGFAAKARDYGYPFFFRPWWELNGNWYSWGRSPDYAAAWRRFRTICDDAGAQNITWTWCCNVIWDPSVPGLDPAPYYPGDAYVDWHGLDGYNWADIKDTAWKSPEELFGYTVKRLREIAAKPIIISETASTERGGSKAEWITQLLTDFLPKHTAVKAVTWFNWNLVENGVRNDWPIESSNSAWAAFKAGIAKGYYRAQLPSLTAGQKVPLP